MSRVGAGETVVVKPKNNLFTWMAAATVLFQVITIGLIFLQMRKFDQ